MGLTIDQERTYSRLDLQVLNLIEQPVWVFDVIKKAMWFANTAAVALWSAESLDDLLARNFSDDMSEATARRLDDYLVKFVGGERLTDQWTFYPNGQGPKTVETTGLGIHIEEGRMAMLMQGVYAKEDLSGKAAQQGLRAVEMLRHLPVAVCQFDANGQVMEQNPEALAAFGSLMIPEDNAASSSGEQKGGVPLHSPLDNISLSPSSDDESTVTDVDDFGEEDEEEDCACDAPHFKSSKTQTCSQFVSRFVDQDLGRRVLNQVKEGKDCSIEALQHTVLGPRWSSIRARQTKDPITAEPVILYSARDISQVVEAKEQAQQADAAKSDFFAFMAHEMRTPLHHVISVIELISTDQQGITGEEKDAPSSLIDTSKLKSLLQSSAKLLMTVIHDLFDRMDGTKDKITLEQTTFTLHDVVDSVVEVVTPKAKMKGIKTVVSIATSLEKWSFVGDPNRLRQILFNLLHNAVKYTQSGKIEVSVRRLPRKQSSLQRVRFTVKDTGIGISLEQRYRLFEKRPLSQLAADTGVGLSICKALVDAMGGEIGVDSRAGSGSTFWFDIPLRKSTSQKSLTDHKTINAINSSLCLESVPDEGGLQILLVDPDEITRKIMTAMLERMGNTVLICCDGLTMIQMIQKHSLDVVMVETELPGLSGVEATRQVRNLGYSRETLPILALTTQSPTPDYPEAGLNDWLTKPLLMRDIKTAMTNAICNCSMSAGTTSLFAGSYADTRARQTRDGLEESMHSENIVSLLSTVILKPLPAH